MITQFTKKGTVKTIKGSITQAVNGGLRLLLLPLSVSNVKHNTTNELTTKLNTRYPSVLPKVKALSNNAWEFKTGSVSTIPVGTDSWVISLCCLNDALQEDKVSLEKSLKELTKLAKLEQDATVHISSFAVAVCPSLVELANEHLIQNGISVNYYQE